MQLSVDKMGYLGDSNVSDAKMKTLHGHYYSLQTFYIIRSLSNLLMLFLSI